MSKKDKCKLAKIKSAKAKLFGIPREILSVKFIIMLHIKCFVTKSILWPRSEKKLCYLCSSLFIFVHLCSSVFICVHLCSPLSYLFIFVQADIVCNILDKFGSCIHLCLTVSIFVHLCSGG